MTADFPCFHCDHLFHLRHLEDIRDLNTEHELETGRCTDCASCWPPDDATAPREQVREGAPA